jgi:hypothetical protein
MFADADEKARCRKDFRLPAVVPMVLYNGRNKWTCARSFKEYLKDYELFVPNITDFTYVVINVNKIDDDELLNKPTLVNLAMLADKDGDPEHVLGRLAKILKLSRKLTKDERVQLKDWIFDVILRKLKGKIDGDEIEQIKEAFEREEESEMTYAIERAIDRIERRGIRIGKIEGERIGEIKGERKGQLKVAIAMIDDGLPPETASKYSGIPADELMQSRGDRKPE